MPLNTLCVLFQAEIKHIGPSLIDETQHPNRGLNITSADNVRDLGGYSTHDGRTTKWGRFVRSGDMDKLTPSDQQKMIDYGINTVIDLRMAKEIAVMPNVFSQSPSVHFYNHDFWGKRFDNYRSTSKGALAKLSWQTFIAVV